MSLSSIVRIILYQKFSQLVKGFTSENVTLSHVYESAGQYILTQCILAIAAMPLMATSVAQYADSLSECP